MLKYNNKKRQDEGKRYLRRQEEKKMTLKILSEDILKNFISNPRYIYLKGV